MKRFILIFLFSRFLYGQENTSQQNDNRLLYFGVDYSFSNTNLVDNIAGLEFIKFYRISDDYDIFLGLNMKIKGELASKNKAYVNKDFWEEGSMTQRFLYLSWGLKFYKYFELTKNSKFFIGTGIEIGFTEGQSIFYEKSMKEPLKANNYGLYNLYPEIGFQINSFNRNFEFFVNYTVSLNKVQPFINSENKYRFQIIGIGIRTLMF